MRFISHGWRFLGSLLAIGAALVAACKLKRAWHRSGSSNEKPEPAMPEVLDDTTMQTESPVTDKAELADVLREVNRAFKALPLFGFDRDRGLSIAFATVEGLLLREQRSPVDKLHPLIRNLKSAIRLLLLGFTDRDPGQGEPTQEAFTGSRHLFRENPR